MTCDHHDACRGDAPPTLRAATLGDVLGEREFGWFSVTHSRFDARRRLAAHAHRFPALTLVHRGGFDLDLGGRHVDCDQRGVFYKLGQHRHANLAGDDGSEQLIVELRTDERHDGEITLPDSSFLAREPGMLRLARDLQREFRTRDAASQLAVEGLVLELLARLLRSRSCDSEGSTPPRWMDDLLELIHASFREPVSVAELADAVGVHPVHLSRSFRRARGVGVGDHVRALRVEYAARRLRNDEASLADIAMDAGFFDQSHFGRCFKRHTGFTPGAYRRHERARRIQA